MSVPLPRNRVVKPSIFVIYNIILFLYVVHTYICDYVFFLNYTKIFKHVNQIMHFIVFIVNITREIGSLLISQLHNHLTIVKVLMTQLYVGIGVANLIGSTIMCIRICIFFWLRCTLP